MEILEQLRRPLTAHEASQICWHYVAAGGKREFCPSEEKCGLFHVMRPVNELPSHLRATELENQFPIAREVAPMKTQVNEYLCTLVTQIAPYNKRCIILDGARCNTVRTLRACTVMGREKGDIIVPNYCVGTYQEIRDAGLCSAYFGSLRAYLDSTYFYHDTSGDTDGDDERGPNSCDDRERSSHRDDPSHGKNGDQSNKKGGSICKTSASTSMDDGSNSADNFIGLVSVSSSGSSSNDINIRNQQQLRQPQLQHQNQNQNQRRQFGLIYLDYCCRLKAGYKSVEKSPIADIQSMFKYRVFDDRGCVLAVCLCQDAADCATDTSDGKSDVDMVNPCAVDGAGVDSRAAKANANVNRAIADNAGANDSANATGDVTTVATAVATAATLADSADADDHCKGAVDAVSTKSSSLVLRDIILQAAKEHGYQVEVHSKRFAYGVVFVDTFILRSSKN
jgi:hypothetical protein